jgi:hypothetical protein
MNKTIETAVISAICAAILLMLLVPAALDYSEKGKQEESTITASASTSWSCEAWILLGGEWTHIDVEDYSLVKNDLVTIYSDDGVKYRTSYENVVIVENGG